jgi:hypothetical protein
MKVLTGLVSYLMQKSVVRVDVEEMSIAHLCVGYLGFPAFDSSTSDSTVRQFLSERCYAYLDYAVPYWAVRLDAGITTLHAIEDTDEISTVIPRFSKLHWSSRESFFFSILSLPSQIPSISEL